MVKKKLNYIDGIVFLSIIIIALAGIWYVSKDDEGDVGSSKVDVVFVAKASNIPEEVLGNIKAGNRVVALSSFQKAKISDVTITDHYIVAAIDGKLEKVISQGFKDIVLKIEGEANKYGPYIDIGGQEIKIGSRYNIETDKFEVPGLIVDIESVDEK